MLTGPFFVIVHQMGVLTRLLTRCQLEGSILALEIYKILALLVKMFKLSGIAFPGSFCCVKIYLYNLST